MVEAAVTDEFLEGLFPPGKADEFFEALYGGAETGAFDIALKFREFDETRQLLILDFVLTERPGKCMACSLTHGLPEVFKRHPVINLENIARNIEKVLSPNWSVREWHVGPTQMVSKKINCIPLAIRLENNNK